MMPFMFNSLLREGGLALEDVRLLRHKDRRAARGRSPYDLWCDNRKQFDLYQSTQSIENRARLEARYWVSFVGTPSDETLFVGIYCVGKRRLLDVDTPMPHMEGVDKAGSCDLYELTIDQALGDLIGRLLVEWGPGDRSWIQRADRQDKLVVELRTAFKEPNFPGFLNFVKPLSELDRLPKSWVTALQSCAGVYLLTCPKTREQYVGSATGVSGFWGRWQDYLQTGHGGNLALKSREPSDYQVSILEVAGTASTRDEVIAMEQQWKRKLQSEDMGLNR
jgi:GIY-YIG catalytic domain-containing protein